MILLSSADLFSKSAKLFQKILSGTLSECQTVWIHAGPTPRNPAKVITDFKIPHSFEFS